MVAPVGSGVHIHDLDTQQVTNFFRTPVAAVSKKLAKIRAGYDNSVNQMIKAPRPSAQQLQPSSALFSRRDVAR